jgi:hypothetical protein
MKLICWLCTAIVAFGCGGTNTPAEHPVEPPRSLGEAPPPASQTEALPEFFWVEVSGNTLLASGTRVDAASLRTMALEEASAGRVRGAALTLNDQTTEQQAGFRHVVVSSRVGLAAQPPASVGAAYAPTPEVTEAPTSEPVQPVAEVATVAPSASGGPRVEVKQMGLHIGGGPNDVEHHAVYADPISLRFEDIRQCYLLVQDNPKKASFGVDLLIPSKGGKAKIENYRTAIGGKDFHLCVLGVFGSIEFKGPGKATMVSYSVLFKPL